MLELRDRDCWAAALEIFAERGEFDFLRDFDGDSSSGVNQRDILNAMDAKWRKALRVMSGERINQTRHVISPQYSAFHCWSRRPPGQTPWKTERGRGQSGFSETRR